MILCVEEFLKTNQFDSLLNASDLNCCKYYDEDKFNDLNRQVDGFLNMFSLNIKSLPKHGGELACYFNILKMQFDIILMTEIRAKNIILMENLLEIIHYIISHHKEIDAEELGFLSGINCKMLPLSMICWLFYLVHASIVKLRAYLLNVCSMELRT